MELDKLLIRFSHLSDTIIHEVKKQIKSSRKNKLSEKNTRSLFREVGKLNEIYRDLTLISETEEEK